MVGFGKSDKYAAEADYSYQMHYGISCSGLLEALDLQRKSRWSARTGAGLLGFGAWRRITVNASRGWSF